MDISEGVQKFHSDPTPRVGGIALVGGFWAAGFFIPDLARGIWSLIGLAGLFAFTAGFAEDITKKVGVRWRLLATILSGLIFALTSGYTITSVDLWGFDALLGITVISLAFTAFAVGGVANAINIIDGFNGLASGTLILILIAFSLVGMRVGDELLVVLALTMAAVVGGFFIVNFPFGKLFFGDAGAYFAGYVVAVLAVMLPARNPEVSPWVSLLILGYPVTETIVSMVRRKLKHGANTGDPDNGHLHHVIQRSLVERTAGLSKFKNSLTGLYMLLFPLLNIALVSLCGLGTLSATSLYAVIVFVYLVLYLGAQNWKFARV